MSFEVKLLVLISLLSVTSITSTRVRNGAYHNIVVEIQKDVPFDDCSNFLLSLENILKLSSEHLHSSFSNRMYYASFDIVLPQKWSDECVKNKIVSNSNGRASDITITTTNEIFGDEVWTQQSGGCGEKGDQIFLGYKSLRDEKLPEQIVKEWFKYRYGVFDLNGFENDPLYPLCGAQEGQICNDAAMIEAKSSQNFPYGNITHSRYFPSKHNFICHRQNPIDVILRHEDFHQNSTDTTGKDQQIAQPIFNYMKKRMTRYMVILDDHIDISVRDSFQFLRDAIRKWIEKDLYNQQTEVGIWMLGNGTKSKEVEQNLIKSLFSSEDREEIFSTIPWYIEQRGGPKCMLNHAITQSTQVMQERSRTHGQANNIILIIAPGMFKCSEDLTSNLVNTANDANIKILTLNYPKIGPNRIQMDELARRTGGESFTIIEQKQNELQSLLTTFFQLTDTLMHISRLHNNDESFSLPTEIYRRKLVDTGSKEENKATSDSFNVDEATDFINFFVYIYDRRERNIEKGMKLISPNNHVFATSSELRAEYHQLQIVGNLTSYGSWSYNIKRFFGNPQPHFVQVLAYPKADSQNFIVTKAFMRRPKNQGPYVIYAQVLQGNLPIVDALVEMSVTFNGREIEAGTQLFDSGSGDPDVTKGDGIYTRYFAISEPGMYVFQIFVTDNGNTAYAKDKFAYASQYDEQDNVTQHCCGSVIKTSPKQVVSPFQRFLTPLTVFIDAEEIAVEKTVLTYTGRVGDLIWRQSEDYKVTLEWSGPDVGRDDVMVNYEVRYATHLKDIVDDFDSLANQWHYAEAIPHNTGQSTSLTINLADEPTLIGQAFFLAIKSITLGELDGPVSNFVKIYVPRKRANQSPHLGSDRTQDTYETDLAIEPSYDDEKSIFPNVTHLLGISMELLIAVVLCSTVFFFAVFICCWLRVCRSRKGKSAKKTLINSPIRQQTSVSVIEPQMSPTYTFRKTSNQFMDPMNGTTFQEDVRDHHIIGLPIDEDMIKPHFTDNDNSMYDEMHHQRRYQQEPNVYDQDIMISSNGTLTRDGRYLSPFESWTASQLLFAHERRQSPIENDQSSMYIDANGDLAPAIPRHPYQNNNYDYQVGDVSRLPPPQYSTVYRPLARSHGQEGSMQSISEVIMNGEKKVRNITMV